MMKKQLGFYYDSEKCSGCKTCQIACKDKNNPGAGILWRRVYEVTSGEWVKRGDAWINNVKAYNMSLACNHCDDPICVKSCPTQAMHKNINGIVLIDEKKCIGCRYCEWACPYGAPKYDSEKGVMTKCNFCEDYIEEGKIPSCVAACPMRVLEYGELKEIQKRHGTENEVYPLPEASVTKPSIVIHLHKDALKIGDPEAKINNREEV